MARAAFRTRNTIKGVTLFELLTPVQDAVSYGTTIGGGPLSWTHTVGANLTDRIVVVAVGHSGNGVGSHNVTEITYGGVAMTPLLSVANTVATSTPRGLRVFYLLNPPAGPSTVSVTLNSSTNVNLVAAATSYSKVNQSTPFDTAVTAEGNSSTTAAVTAATNASSDRALAWCVARNAYPDATASGFSYVGDCNNGNTYLAAWSKTGTAGNQNASFTWTSAPNNYCVGAVAMNGSITPTITVPSHFTRVFREDFDTLVAEGDMFHANNINSQGIKAGDGKGYYADKFKCYPSNYLTTIGQQRTIEGDNNSPLIGDHYSTEIISVVSGITGANGNCMRFRMHRSDIDGKVWAAAPIPLISIDRKSGTRTYGGYEIRFRTDPTPGYHPAHLLWNVRNYLQTSDPNYLPWPQAGENDLIEGLTNGTAGAFHHNYGGTTGGSQDVYQSTAKFVDWHVYRCEWTPGKCQYWIDGVLLKNTAGQDGSYGSKVVPDPMQWILQTENDNSRNNQPGTGAASVCNAYVDYVQYESWAA